MKKIEQSIRNLWNKFMWPNMYAQLKYQKQEETIHKENLKTEENGIHIEKPEESEENSYHN